MYTHDNAGGRGVGQDGGYTQANKVNRDMQPWSIESFFNLILDILLWSIGTRQNDASADQ